MQTSSGLFQLGLWAMTALVLVGSVWVVALPNLFRAALSLGLVLLGVAGMFVLVGAEFLAFVQVLVYVGAVLTLVIFAVMLTARAHHDRPEQASRPAGSAAALSAGLFVVLAGMILRVPWEPAASARPVTLEALGHTLVTTLALPFEIISLVLVAAMVGAIAVASSFAPRRTPSSK